MMLGIAHTLPRAVAATGSVPWGRCRSPPPSAIIGRLRLLQFTNPNSLSSSGLSHSAPRNFITISSLRSRILPHVLSSFTISVLVSGMSISRVGASGSSSVSSSASNIGMVATPEDVLQFWFTDIDPQNDVYMRKEWFRGGPDFDEQCEKAFGETLKLASTGALNGWMKTRRGRLALVIVLDQIPRNIHRNSSLSFSQDQSAVKITLEAIEQGLDKELTPWERWFLYIPLMHSENLGHHDIADRVYKEMADENSNNEKLHQVLLSVVEIERKHCAVLKKFGRYPQRNAALGRSNTREEEEFLSGGGGW